MTTCRDSVRPACASSPNSSGTTGTDTATSIAVNGNSVYVGSVDNGDAVVRSFDTTDPKAVTLTASQDLGNLGGGSLVGIGMNNGQLVVAGTARNTSLGSGRGDGG